MDLHVIICLIMTTTTTTTTTHTQINILLCISGSVATLKIPELINQLLNLNNNNNNIHIKFVFSSEKAQYFYNQSQHYDPIHWLQLIKSMKDNINQNVMMIYEEDEWNLWKHMDDPVLHIELCKWADIILIVPASANMIAKISSGISDSLVLSILRAIDLSHIDHSSSSSSSSSSSEQKHQHIFLCPAMNTAMWSHPITNQHINELEKWGYQIIKPISKKLACGDQGVGALASIDTIIGHIKNAISNDNCMGEYTRSFDSSNRISTSDKNKNLDILLQRATSIRNSNQQSLFIRNNLTMIAPMIIGITIGATMMAFLYTLKKR